MPRLSFGTVAVVGAILLFSAACGGSSPLEIQTPTQPVATATPRASQPVATATTEPAGVTPQANEYTVQPGDTLSGIAAQFGVTVEELAALNGIDDPNSIAAGQVLQIPSTP